MKSIFKYFVTLLFLLTGFFDGHAVDDTCAPEIITNRWGWCTLKRSDFENFLLKVKAGHKSGASQNDRKYYYQAIEITRLEFTGDTSVKELPSGIGLLFRLKELSLMDFGLEKLPDDIIDLDRLEQFLSKGNNIKALPRGFGSLEKITKLNLSGNPLDESCFNEIGKLTNLKELDLNSCQLKKFPPQILWLTKLKELYLENNDIDRVPERIRHLKELTHFSIINNGEVESSQTTYDFLGEIHVKAVASCAPKIPRSGAIDIDDKTELEHFLKKIQIGSAPNAPQIARDYFDEAQKVTSLKLSTENYCRKQNIKTIPPGIGQLLNLKELCLINFDLKELPEDIAHLKTLESFSLYHEDILSHNPYKETLPEVFSSLKGLKKLCLSSKRLCQESYDEIEKLEDLEELYLDSCKLQEFPVQLCSLKKLKILRLRYNSIDCLPPEIANMETLEDLNLDFSKLQELPAQLCSLKKLRVLTLSNNKIDSVSSQIASLKNLKRLNLKDNKLTSLPREIAALTKLKILNLSHNKFEEFPLPVCSLRSLQELDLSMNKMKELPEEICRLTKLETLVARFNELTALPHRIGSLRSLKFLDLSNNRLKRLPNGFWSLKELQHLDLCSNSVAILPSEIRQLKNLETLILIHNNFTFMPKEIGELVKLRKLLLEYGSNRTFPETMANLTNVKYFSYYYKLRYIPKSLHRWFQPRDNNKKYYLDKSDNPPKRVFLKKAPVSQIKDGGVVKIEHPAYAQLLFERIADHPELQDEVRKIDVDFGANFNVNKGLVTHLQQALREKNVDERQEFLRNTIWFIKKAELIPEDLLFQVAPRQEAIARAQIEAFFFMLEKDPEFFSTVRTGASQINFADPVDETLICNLLRSVRDKQGDERYKFAQNVKWLLRQLDLVPEVISRPVFGTNQETLKCETQPQAEAFFFMLTNNHWYYKEMSEKLTHLDLSGLNLTEFPTALFALKNLRVLDLMHNHLEEIPASIAVFLRNLEWLHLEHNNLDALPETIWMLPELSFLGLGENNLQTLPSILHLPPKLQSITLNDNPLAIDAFPALNMLRKGALQLEGLPEELQLEFLNNTIDAIMPQTQILQLLGYPVIARPNEEAHPEEDIELEAPPAQSLLIPHPEIEQGLMIENGQ
ncbi:hypothetical protein HOD08_01105 [bacterium]|nr:hypothetical protein [bacterium]